MTYISGHDIVSLTETLADIKDRFVRRSNARVNTFLEDLHANRYSKMV